MPQEMSVTTGQVSANHLKQDYACAGGRYGGAITAALFLEQFVHTDSVEWGHVDLAGIVLDNPLTLGACSAVGHALSASPSHLCLRRLSPCAVDSSRVLKVLSIECVCRASPGALSKR